MNRKIKFLFVVLLFCTQVKSQEVQLQSLIYWKNIYGVHPNNGSIPATFNYYYSASQTTPVANHIFKLDTNTGQLISDGCAQVAIGAYLGEEYLLMTAAGYVTYPRFREAWTIAGNSYSCHGSSQVHIPVSNAADNFLNTPNNWSNPSTWDNTEVPDFISAPAVFINRPVNLDASLNLGNDKTIYIKSGGELVILPGQTVTSNTTIYAEPGALFQNDGQFNGGERIQGSFTNHGVFSPGNPIGALTIDGNYNASSTAVHAFEISSLSSFDNLYITGSAAINGALNVSLSGGYTPVLGNTFKIFSFASGSGTFSSTSLPSLPEGLYWKLNYNPTDVTLEVTDVYTPPAHCVPVIESQCENASISFVQVGILMPNNGLLSGIYNGSECNGYTDYSGTLFTKARPGQTLTYAISSPLTSGQLVDIYVDYNNSGDFTDPGEHVAIDKYMEGFVANVFGDFIIPVDQPYGTYKMRIICHANGTVAVPCLVENGEVEDYTLIIESCVPYDATLGVWWSSTNNICSGETAILDVFMPNIATSDYFLYYSDGIDNFSVGGNVNMQDPHIPISVSPTTSTTYNLVSVVDLYGCPATLNGTVTVNVGALNITPSATISQPTCAVSTGTITLDIPSGTGYSYSIGGAYQSSPEFSNLPAGQYTLSLQNGGGCVSSETTIVTINDQPLPPAVPGSVTGLVNVCAYVGTNTPLTYSVNPDPNASGFQWVVPPSVTLLSGQGTNTITVTIGAGFITSANKQIRVKALSTCGNSADKLLYLKAQLPSTPTTIFASSSNVCSVLGSNTPITYQVLKVPGASSYIWTAQAGTTVITHPNGSGENDTIVNITFSAGFATSVLTVQAVNDCGTSAIRNISITRSNPVVPGLISGPSNICAYISPNGVLATYTVAAVSTVANYNWTIPAGALSVTGQGTNSISFIYPPGYTSGTITVMASNGCGTSGPRNLAVSRLNPATPSIIDVIQVQDCPARRYSYTISSMPSNASGLVWSIPAGATLVSGSGTTSILVEYPPTAVIGTVSVTALSNCANSSTRTTSVKIPACPPAFAKGSLGENILAEKKTEPDADFIVYPNPTSTEFQMKAGSKIASPLKIRVLDASGRVLQQFTYLAGQVKSFGADWKPGIYFVEIQCDSGKIVRRLLKL